MVLDSGKRRKFESGAVRDCAEGKGRCDLLPLGVVGHLIESNTITWVNDYMVSGDMASLIAALRSFSRERDWSIYDMLLEVSIHYEEGATKYSERNWEQGIPLHCYIDSAVRHYLKFLRGDMDERHDRAFVWNILGAIWTQTYKPEMIDLPFKESENE